MAKSSVLEGLSDEELADFDATLDQPVRLARGAYTAAASTGASSTSS
jgi:hypothetical protein